MNDFRLLAQYGCAGLIAVGLTLGFWLALIAGASLIVKAVFF